MCLRVPQEAVEVVVEVEMAEHWTTTVVVVVLVPLMAVEPEEVAGSATFASFERKHLRRWHRWAPRPEVEEEEVASAA